MQLSPTVVLGMKVPEMQTSPSTREVRVARIRGVSVKCILMIREAFAVVK